MRDDVDADPMPIPIPIPISISIRDRCRCRNRRLDRCDAVPGAFTCEPARSVIDHDYDNDNEASFAGSSLP